MARIIPDAALEATRMINDLNNTQAADYSEYKKGIDDISDRLKRSIVCSKSVYDKSKVTFYVSNSGDDANDGRSPETAWKSLDKINDPEAVCENCNILFERGGLWRGFIKVPHSGITYSAYGVGMKPRLYGSKRNYAHPSCWKKSKYENVWYTDQCTKNVGLVAINHSDVLGKYDEIMCNRNIVGKDGFEGPWQLCKEFDFYGHLDEAITYLYCDRGNPGDVYESIELGEFYDLISPAGDARKDLVFDNLCLKFVGCHGIAGLHTRENVTVQNCIFCYLGGSILDGHAGVRTEGYGNAVETCACNGFYVQANWIYQIYDTAITHQCSAGEHECDMTDVEYLGNLCEYCHWSIEFYNIPKQGIKRTVTKNHIHHNILRCGGYGWGSAGRKAGSALFNSFGLPSETSDFTSYSNIFDRCAGGIIRFVSEGDKKIKCFENTYIQYKNGNLGDYFGVMQSFDNAQEKILECCREENARAFYAE